MFEPWLILILAAIACITAFAWFALAMDVHWKQIQARPGPGLPLRKTLRLLGSVGLLVSAALCFIADRPSMAILVWIMFLAASAPLIGMLLAWRPQLLRVFWPFH
jgi:hypothetical protein